MLRRGLNNDITVGEELDNVYSGYASTYDLDDVCSGYDEQQTELYDIKTDLFDKDIEDRLRAFKFNPSKESNTINPKVLSYLTDYVLEADLDVELKPSNSTITDGTPEKVSSSTKSMKI